MEYLTLRGSREHQLARSIDVSQKAVIVRRLIIPKRFQNFGKFTLTLKHNAETYPVTFPAGHYASVERIAETLSFIFPTDDGKEIVDVDHDPDQLTITLNVVNPRNSLILPSAFAKKLHLPKTIRGKYASSAPINLLKSFYVQASFVESQPINETSMKLLYVAHDHHSTEYVLTPCKVGLNCETLSVARFWITDENNEMITFVEGEPVLQIQFVHK